ncbi:hypothetical protein AB0407_37785, partial [Streptomyces microflavus]|uniref:hypothetical protein n=1 Tax=Streptomyces microflavus TaxID=1919 RepID=UPI00344B9953
GRAVLGGARRNLAAAGAGALLIAVLGTVVTPALAARHPPNGHPHPPPPHPPIPTPGRAAPPSPQR